MSAKPTYEELEHRIKVLEESAIEAESIQKAYQESEEKFAQSFLKSPIPMAITAMKDGRYIDVNEAFAKVMGLTREELMRNTSTSVGFITAEQRALFLDECRQKGSVENLELQMCVKGGELRYGLFNSSKIAISGEHFFLTMVTDITDRKQIEKALHDSEERYRLLVDSINKGIIVAQDGMLKFVNPMFMEITGHSKQDLTTMPFTEIVHPDDRAIVSERHIRRMKGEIFPTKYEFRIIASDGSTRWLELDSVMIKWEGRPAALAFTGDITELKEAENALKVSEERFRKLIELLPEAVYEIDMKGVLTFGNNKLFETFGYTREDYVYDVNIFDAVVPDDLSRASKNAQRIMNGEDIGPNAYTLRRKDGSIFPSVIHSAAIVHGGKPVGLRGVITDITKYKQAEEALRLSHQRVLDIIEFLPDATFVIDHEKRVVAWNKAIEEMTGVRKEDIIGKGDCVYAIPFYGEPRPIAIDLVFEKEEENIEKYDYMTKQGGVLLAEVYVPMTYQEKGAYLSARASALRDPRGNVVGAIESIRDITEQKQIARELEESEERYRTAIESSNDGVIMAKEGRFIYVNRKFLETFGLGNIDQVVGQPIGFMVHPDDRERVVDIHRCLQQSEEVQGRYEFKGIKKNGDTVFIEVSATRTTYKGEPIVLAYLRDVTARKGLEDQLRQSQNLESIGTLAGGIAHDFNNLLMGLVGNISLARMSLSPGDKASSFLEEAERMSLAGADLTKRLIAFAKGGVSIRKVISMNRLIMESADHAGAGSDIQYFLPDDLLPVKADEAQMRQVIHSIVVNAKEAMPHGGTITLSSANIAVTPGDTLPLPSGDYVKITIEDQGTGIKGEDLPKIFDPYFTTKKLGAERGMGLGLALVYSVIKKHSGHVGVESIPGKGTTVNVYLPAHKTEEYTIGEASGRT